MIDGTKTLGQVASSMLKQIASQMLQQRLWGHKVNGIGGMLLSGLGSIFGGGASTAGPGGFQLSNDATPKFKMPGFPASKGGQSASGKPSIVGEKGPEPFVPSTSGTIVPNGQFGGANGCGER